MALTRKARIWLIVLSIPVVLVIAAAITLKLYFTSDRLKAMIVPAMEDATGRTVTMDDVSLSLFPTFAVEMDGLTISNLQGQGFSEQPFVTLGRLELQVSLLALLKNSVEIDNIILEKPRLLAEVNHEGLANYILEGKPEEEGDVDVKVKVEADSRTRFLLSNFEVIDGTIEYINRKEDYATTIGGLNQKVRMEFVPTVNEMRIRSSSSIDNFSYGSVSAPLISNLKMTLDQDMLYEVEKDVLTLQNGKGTLQDIALTVNGKVTDLQKRFMMDIVVESADVNIADLLSLAPKEYMTKAEGLKGNGMAQIKITISGTVDDTTKADIAGLVSATGASIQYASLPKPITNINLVADFTKTMKKQEFRLTKFSANLGNNPLSATMTVVNFDDPSLTMAVNASMNLADVKDYYPLEPGTQMNGTIKADVDIAGKVSVPAAMKATGKMEFQRVTMKTADSQNPVENLNGVITFNNQVIESKQLSMNLGKSDLSLVFWLRNYLSLISDDEKVPKATANLTLTSKHLRTADVMSEEKTGEAQGAGKTQETKGGGLPLPNADMNVTASVGRLTMEKLELTNVRSAMTISNGVINLQNFSGNTFDGAMNAKGTLNLQKPERPLFDLAMEVSKVKANPMLSNFTSFGQRLFGDLTMSTTLKGALDDTLGLVPQSLNGQGQVQVENGQLKGVKVNSEIANLLKAPDLAMIDFKNWANAFSISDGRIVIKDLNIKALGADYIIGGSQGLLDGSLDYTLTLVLSEATSAKVNIPGFAGEAAAIFKDPSGRVRLDLGVGGTFDAPKVSLDTKSAQQRAGDLLKQKAADEAKKREEELKKKAGDALKGLFKRKE